MDASGPIRSVGFQSVAHSTVRSNTLKDFVDFIKMMMLGSGVIGAILSILDCSDRSLLKTAKCRSSVYSNRRIRFRDGGNGQIQQRSEFLAPRSSLNQETSFLHELLSGNKQQRSFHGEVTRIRKSGHTLRTRLSNSQQSIQSLCGAHVLDGSDNGAIKCPNPEKLFA